MPIINIPTSSSLDRAALRFHFAAWDTVMSLVANFDYFSKGERSKEEVDERWMAYMSRASNVLQDAYMFIALSGELALKARLAAVSPFLLLMGSGNRFPTSNKEIDFSELKTVDAIELPALVNSFCPTPVGKEFIAQYSRVRSLRNKIVHIGYAPLDAELGEVLHLASEQYLELWRDRFFMRWIESEADRERSLFYDYKNYTEYTDVVMALPYLKFHLKSETFEKLFGFSREKCMYLCCDCVAAACLERLGSMHTDYASAQLVGENTLHCAVCQSSMVVERKACLDQDCTGDVIFSDEMYSEFCCTCGEWQEAIALSAG